MPLIDIKSYKKDFFKYIKSQLEGKKKQLVLHIISINPNSASQKYINLKKKIANKLGIKILEYNFNEDVELTTLEKKIYEFAEKKEGCIVQLPIPLKLQPILKKIPPIIDVDLLNPDSNLLWNRGYLPPTIGAIDIVLKHSLKLHNFEEKNQNNSFLEFKDYDLQTQLDLEGLAVCVVGQGTLVGEPLLKYLKSINATILSLNSKTRHIKSYFNFSKIVITATGQGEIFDGNDFLPKTLVIDASTSESFSGLKGDVKLENIKNIRLSPSPGGIGSLTVLYLFYNLLLLENF